MAETVATLKIESYSVQYHLEDGSSVRTKPVEVEHYGYDPIADQVIIDVHLFKNT